eukprot:SAG31_NODE_65_length_28565_cov_8.402914_38_plen_84_part_00
MVLTPTKYHKSCLTIIIHIVFARSKFSINETKFNSINGVRYVMEYGTVPPFKYGVRELPLSKTHILIFAFYNNVQHSAFASIN